MPRRDGCTPPSASTFRTWSRLCQPGDGVKHVVHHYPKSGGTAALIEFGGGFIGYLMLPMTWLMAIIISPIWASNSCGSR